MLQPPPPAALAILTLDPTLGTIVEIDPDGGSASGDSNSGGYEDDPEPGAPTSWLPIAGFSFRVSLAAGIWSIVDRVDALLDEVGISRLQLLLLMIVAPLATAFLIDVVATMLSGR